MLPVAKVLKSFGTDGGVLVSSTVDLQSLDLEEPVFITFDGLQVPFFILDCQPKGGKYVLHLNDTLNLTDAEELVGRTIFADVQTEEEEGIDFEGWTIFDHGKELGPCTGMEDIPGNPCLTVTLSHGQIPSPHKRARNDIEVLIPLHEDFITGIDEDRRILFLNLPEGLY